MEKKKIIVGLSGGLDSFVTALMLQEKGFEVIGVNLQLWGKNDLSEVEALTRSLHIPLMSVEGEKLFREVVVDAFVKGYLSAFTPSPCCTCNSYVKWQLLAGMADRLQIPLLATGHYVRIIKEGEKYYLWKGKDKNKDQSYFLWGISQQILSRAVTPLGDYTKAEVKAWALQRGYQEMIRKKESMGICFLQGRDYRDFIRQYVPEIQESRGRIVDRTGKVIGEHNGLLNYTIGQKKGLPAVQGQAMYVAEMKVEQNLIIADRKEGLETRTLKVGQLVMTDFKDLEASDIRVKVRGLGLNPEGPVRLGELKEGSLAVFLSTPAWAVAPGQPVAFYRGDKLIGGGIARP